MRQFRIVQVAPLIHRGAYVVQQNVEVLDFDSFTKTNHHIFNNLGYPRMPIDEAKRLSLPTKKQWVTENVDNPYMVDRGRYDSYYEAYSYIKRQGELATASRIEKEELENWKLTHGANHVLEYIDVE